MAEYLLHHTIIFWLALAVIFAVAEGLTLSMITIWFTAGAAVATVVAAFGGDIWVQFIAFVAVSTILLIFTRPVLVKHLKVGREKNNVEALEGKTGLVTKAIEPFGSGLVKTGGIVWTAIGENQNFTAQEGETVEIIRVEGVKLIVKELEERTA
ncbi:MAG: NfeD family protein [Clostridiales Family XIII bacterium]|jgi:membrane protein implicated in regulation of membrane protease activity|nr:NfeD family protein [Clostridiales Family XIII bacterium]